MMENRIIDAMNAIDDDLLSEALADNNSGRRERISNRFIRGRIAAVIAAALIVVGGAAAYATGLLTLPVKIHNSLEEKTNTIMYKGEEVVLFGISSHLEGLKEKEISGQVRTDAASLIQERKAKGELDWGIIIHPDGREEKEYLDQYSIVEKKEFGSQAEALKYIGCSYYEEQYFPYEKGCVTVEYSAILKKNSPVNRLQMTGCSLIISSIDEKIDVKASVETSFMKGGNDAGIGSYYDDGTYKAETYTTTNGYNCGKVYKTGLKDGKIYSTLSLEDLPDRDKYTIDGVVVKNNCLYKINIVSEWEDKAAADRIFDDWASAF